MTSGGKADPIDKGRIGMKLERVASLTLGSSVTPVTSITPGILNSKARVALFIMEHSAAADDP